jgi:hypothetical protein
MDPMIVAVACVDFQDVMHITDIEATLDEIVEGASAFYVGKVAFPYDWYVAIHPVDKKGYEDLKKQYNLR